MLCTCEPKSDGDKKNFYSPSDIIDVICQPQIEIGGRVKIMKKLKNNDDMNSLSHTKWNCMYHVVFTPKYRRKAIYSKLRRDIGRYLRRLCEYKGLEIVEANACSDHIYIC